MKGQLSSSRSNLRGRPARHELPPTVPERRRQQRLPADEEVTLLWTDADGQHQMPRVKVLDHSNDGFSLRSQEPLRAGFEVWISDRSGIHKTSVRHCEQEGDHYVVGLYRISREQRRVARVLVDGSATLDWPSETGGHRSAEVEILNASDGGFQIDSSEAVPKETLVRVTGESVECFGTVWYCRNRGDRYLIGIQLTRAPHLKDSPDYQED